MSSESHFERGIEAFHAGRLKESVEHFLQAIARTPSEPRFHLALGNSCFALGKFREALVAFQTTIKLQHDCWEAYLGQIAVYEHRSQWKQAVDCCQRILKHTPHHAEAHGRLAKILERQGHIEPALFHYQQACQHGAEDWNIWNRRGRLLGHSGRHAEAESCFRTILAHDPDQADVWNNLGVSLVARKRWDDAVECFERAFHLDSQRGEFQKHLGQALFHLKRWDEAVRRFQSFLAIKPKNLEVSILRGMAQEQLQDWTSTKTSWKHVLKIHPQNVEALCGLARLAEREEHWQEAALWASNALKQDARHAEAHGMLARFYQRSESLPHQSPETRLKLAEAHAREALNQIPTGRDWNTLGNILYRLEQYQEAFDCFQNAVGQDPQLAEAHDHLGNAYLEQGDFSAAKTCFEQAIVCRPSLGRAHFHLVQCRQGSQKAPIDGSLFLLEKQLECSELSPSDRKYFHFALAKCLQDLGRYEEAFPHYEAGNQLTPRPEFGGELPLAISEMIPRIEGIFSEDFFQTLKMRGSDSDQPIFIVGLPRSGTTLVEHILSSHPEISGAGELKTIGRITERISAGDGSPLHYPEAIPLLDAPRLKELANEYLKRLRQETDSALRLTDKMPTNFLHLGLIAVLFPQARIIHCRRDVRDVCLSCFQQNLDWPFCDLEELGRYIHDYARLMAHWRRGLSLPMFEIHYETLVASPESTIRGLIEFCDVKWNDQCLAFHESSRAVRTPSKMQVRNPINQSAVGRWHHYAKQLQPWLKSLEGLPPELFFDHRTAS